MEGVRSRILIGGCALILWCAYWRHVYVAALVPDERKDKVAALVLGLGVTLAMASGFAFLRAFKAMLRIRS